MRHSLEVGFALLYAMGLVFACGSDDSGGGALTDASAGKGGAGNADGGAGSPSGGTAGSATGGTAGAAGSGGAGGSGTSFACGAGKTCQPGEYCEKFIPGACGGPPPDDAGACPPDCNPTTCGSSEQICLCLSFTCNALPSGCNGCACFSIPTCSCSEDPNGGVYLTCAGA